MTIKSAAFNNKKTTATATATAKHSVISMLLFLLVITPFFSGSFSFSAASSSLSLVEGICKESQNYSFCIEALESDPRTSAVKNHMDLAVIALEIGISDSTGTLNYIARLYRNPKTKPQHQSALKGCLWGYDGAVASSKSALSELTVDPLKANYDAKVAGDGAVYCSEFMASAGIKDSSMSEGNFFILSFSNIAFLITFHME